MWKAIAIVGMWASVAVASIVLKEPILGGFGFLFAAFITGVIAEQK